MVDYIKADPLLAHLPEKEIVDALTLVGFTDELRSRLITNLSGGGLLAGDVFGGF